MNLSSLDYENVIAGLTNEKTRKEPLKNIYIYILYCNL